MATRGVEMTITYVAWDTSNNVGKTGDVANHTLRWVKDGTSGAPTNSASEVDATNAPGLYKLTLTSTETDANIGVLHGASSTANISIMPTTIQFERLPNAAPGGNGGVPTVDANNRIAGVQGTKNTFDDLNDFDASTTSVDLNADQSGVTIGTCQTNADMRGTDDAFLASSAPTNFSSLAINASGHISRVTLTDTTTTNTDMRGTDNAFLAANAPTNFSDLTITATTGLVSLAADQSGVTIGTVNELGTQAKADVNAEADSAIETYHLDHIFAAAYDPSSKPGNASGLFNVLVENDGGVPRYTVNALENAPSGSGASAEAIADAVWDEARSGHTTAGTFGEGVASVQGNVTGSVASVTAGVSLSDGAITSAKFGAGAITATVIATNAIDADAIAADAVTEIQSGLATSAEITALNDISTADVKAQADAALTDINLDHLVKNAVDTNFATTVHLDSVIGHLADTGTSATFDRTTDSTEGIRNRGDSAWTTVSTSDVADAVLDEAISGHTTSGTLGEQVQPVYHANIDLRVDGANSQDEWTVVWFKNDAAVTSNITSPTIQVIKRADGTDLIAETAMTQIGSTGMYKYDESTNRTTAGEAVIAIVSATIDGSERTWRQPLGRDSSA